MVLWDMCHRKVYQRKVVFVKPNLRIPNRNLWRIIRPNSRRIRNGNLCQNPHSNDWQNWLKVTIDYVWAIRKEKKVTETEGIVWLSNYRWSWKTANQITIRLRSKLLPNVRIGQFRLARPKIRCEDEGTAQEQKTETEVCGASIKQEI